MPLKAMHHCLLIFAMLYLDYTALILPNFLGLNYHAKGLDVEVESLHLGQIRPSGGIGRGKVLPPHSPCRFQTARGQMHLAYLPVDGVNCGHQTAVVTQGLIEKAALPATAASQFPEHHPGLDIHVAIFPDPFKQLLGRRLQCSVSLSGRVNEP